MIVCLALFIFWKNCALKFWSNWKLAAYFLHLGAVEGENVNFLIIYRMSALKQSTCYSYMNNCRHENCCYFIMRRSKLTWWLPTFSFWAEFSWFSGFSPPSWPRFINICFSSIQFRSLGRYLCTVTVSLMNHYVAWIEWWRTPRPGTAYIYTFAKSATYTSVINIKF